MSRRRVGSTTARNRAVLCTFSGVKLRPRSCSSATLIRDERDKLDPLKCCVTGRYLGAARRPRCATIPRIEEALNGGQVQRAALAVEGRQLCAGEGLYLLRRVASKNAHGSLPDGETSMPSPLRSSCS